MQLSVQKPDTCEARANRVGCGMTLPECSGLLGSCVRETLPRAICVYRGDGALLGVGLNRLVAQVVIAFQTGAEFDMVMFQTNGQKVVAVCRFCLATGWKAMKGDDAEWFLSQDPRRGKTVGRVWRRVLVDPSMATRRSRVRRHLLLFQWSNHSLKDNLALFTHGVVGQWTIPKKTGRDYIDQITAEVREEREDSRRRIKVLWVQKRRDNHYLDCELMIDAAGHYLRVS